MFIASLLIWHYSKDCYRQYKNMRSLGKIICKKFRPLANARYILQKSPIYFHLYVCNNYFNINNKLHVQTATITHGNGTQVAMCIFHIIVSVHLCVGIFMSLLGYKMSFGVKIHRNLMDNLGKNFQEPIINIPLYGQFEIRANPCFIPISTFCPHIHILFSYLHFIPIFAIYAHIYFTPISTSVSPYPRVIPFTCFTPICAFFPNIRIFPRIRVYLISQLKFSYLLHPYAPHLHPPFILTHRRQTMK